MNKRDLRGLALSGILALTLSFNTRARNPKSPIKDDTASLSGFAAKAKDGTSKKVQTYANPLTGLVETFAVSAESIYSSRTISLALDRIDQRDMVLVSWVRPARISLPMMISAALKISAGSCRVI